MVKVVFKRELLNLFRSKGQRISFFVMAFLILAGGIVGRIIIAANEDDASPTQVPRIVVGLATENNALSDLLTGAKFDVERIPVDEQPTEWLKAQTKGGDPDNDESNDAISYYAIADAQEAQGQYVIYSTDSQLESLITTEVTATIKRILTVATVQQIIPGGLNAEQSSALNQTMNTEVIYISTTDPHEGINAIETNPLGYIAGMIASLLLFMSVIIGINIISQGVVEEKSSRVVEILLSSIPPRKLLLGKLLGIGTFVLVEVSLLLSCSLISAMILGVNINLSIGTLTIWSLVWVIVGFFIYATLVAGIAATVSRSEELGAAQTPIVFAMLIPFYLGIYLVPFQSDALYTRILSWIPGVSSFMMPMRQALDAYSWWEPWLALILAIATIPALASLAGRIYHNSILRMGQRVKLREALKGA